jgi:hypothetical protein
MGQSGLYYDSLVEACKIVSPLSITRETLSFLSEYQEIFGSLPSRKEKARRLFLSKIVKALLEHEAPKLQKTVLGANDINNEPQDSMESASSVMLSSTWKLGLAPQSITLLITTCLQVRLARYGSEGSAGTLILPRDGDLAPFLFVMDRKLQSALRAQIPFQPKSKLSKDGMQAHLSRFPAPAKVVVEHAFLKAMGWEFCRTEFGWKRLTNTNAKFAQALAQNRDIELEGKSATYRRTKVLSALACAAKGERPAWELLPAYVGTQTLVLSLCSSSGQQHPNLRAEISYTAATPKSCQ